MLEVRKLSVTYPGQQVLTDINLSVGTGQRLAILGPNGSGKSTLLKSLSGLVEYRGEIKLSNRSLRDFKRIELAEKVALLSQNTSMYFSYSVYETLMMGLYTQLRKSFMAVARAKDKARVLQVMEALDLENIRDQELSKLSGGQLQRVFFARTLLQNPKIILLDEPNNHLDIHYQLEMLRYIEEYFDQGKTVIAVFHDIDLALSFSENILILKEGKILSQGKAKEILSREFLKQVYQTDVLDYMLQKHKFWKGLEEGER
ncbi:MAG TPA: ABC transporter ATP-binding protein [Lactococcus sp.]|uniref:ABC transporter ATP-binding protein n=1 Tax=Lactococcus TaxID=1357 RepID=UPI000E924FB4|nr:MULTISPECIES: ABC transporter ATP-binding protein [Lactococcus]HAP15688.1 ABC transporter ATP-binding protein [Lactococcus sp.]HBC90877.1 ABC transporter ATP-binding protein [Lactococcus sp.]